MSQLLAIFRDIPGFLEVFTAEHGPWVYAVLFAIVFCETGLVVTPFLPGDSLLFAVGALCGTGTLEFWIAAPLLFAAAVIGNTSNYFIGRATGPKVFRGESTALLARLMSKKHLASANRFFCTHGGKAVSLAQFVPIARTFVPYVAGAGAMPYGRFIFFNVAGALLWVGVCTTAGYFFGNLPFVKKNFEWIIIGVVVISLLPLLVQWVRSRLRPAQPCKV